MGKVVEMKQSPRKYMVFGDEAVPFSAYRIITALEFFGPINAIIEDEDDVMFIHLEIIDGSYYLTTPIYGIKQLETGVYGLNNSAFEFPSVEQALDIIRGSVNRPDLIELAITGLEGKVNG